MRGRPRSARSADGGSRTLRTFLWSPRWRTHGRRSPYAEPYFPREVFFFRFGLPADFATSAGFFVPFFAAMSPPFPVTLPHPVEFAHPTSPLDEFLAEARRRSQLTAFERQLLSAVSVGEPQDGMKLDAVGSDSGLTV